MTLSHRLTSGNLWNVSCSMMNLTKKKLTSWRERWITTETTAADSSPFRTCSKICTTYEWMKNFIHVSMYLADANWGHSIKIKWMINTCIYNILKIIKNNSKNTGTPWEVQITHMEQSLPFINSVKSLHLHWTFVAIYDTERRKARENSHTNHAYMNYATTIIIIVIPHYLVNLMM